MFLLDQVLQYLAKTRLRLFFFYLRLSVCFNDFLHRQLVVVLWVVLVVLGLVGKVLIVLLFLPLHQELEEDLLEFLDFVLSQQPLRLGGLLIV